MRVTRETIYQNKIKFLRFQVEGNKEWRFVPYTLKAINRISGDEIKYFSPYSFHRIDTKGYQKAKKYGDWHISVSIRETNAIDLRDAFYNILSLFFREIGLRQIDPSCLMGDIQFNRDHFNFSLPSRFFRLEGGSDLLPEIYECINEVAVECSKHLKCNYFRINSRVLSEEEVKSEIQNSGLPHTIPQGLSDFCNNVVIPVDKFNLLKRKAGAKRLEKKAARLVRTCDFIKRVRSMKVKEIEDNSFVSEAIRAFPMPIRAKFFKEILVRNNPFLNELIHSKLLLNRTSCEQIKKQKLCFQATCTCRTPLEMISNWPVIKPLPIAAEYNVNIDILECAILILQKIKELSVSELQQRDVHRLVEGSFPTSEDLEPGIRLLEEHNFLTRIYPPQTCLSGRPPSPWILVNELWDGEIF